jgi:integrase
MTLHDSLSDYLAMRRSLGYKLERQEKLLHQFLAYLEGHDEDLITTEHALAWATEPGAGQAWHSLRMQAVRGFANYLHASDAEVEVPAPWLLPTGPHRATPYLYTDEQIAGLIAAASTLRFSHLVATYATVIGLLAVTGMRGGEVTRLDRSDFDPREGVLVVRDTKFGKSRELPLQDSTVAALRRYLHRSDRPPSPPGTVALFVSMPGTRLSMACLEHTFRMLRARAGIQPRSGRCRPRLHDLRH